MQNIRRKRMSKKNNNKKNLWKYAMKNEIYEKSEKKKQNKRKTNLLYVSSVARDPNICQINGVIKNAQYVI